MKLVDIDMLKNEDVCEHCEYKSTRCEYTCGDNGNEVETLWQMIDNLPEVIAKPIAHGYWQHSFNECYWNKWTCSECGFYEITDTHVSLSFNYCPNCGAKMNDASE